MDYSSVEKKVNTFFRRLVPENARSLVVGDQNLTFSFRCSFFSLIAASTRTAKRLP